MKFLEWEEVKQSRKMSRRICFFRQRRVIINQLLIFDWFLIISSRKRFTLNSSVGICIFYFDAYYK